MKAMEKLDQHLRTRIPELGELKRSGVKIIGYTPGAYFPEELVFAAGAIPIQLVRGGDPEAVQEAYKYHVRWLDTFARTQIVYQMSREEPLYDLADTVVAQVTDHNMRAIGSALKLYSDIDVYKFGVPHARHQWALEYYLDNLRLLKRKLEEVTGNSVDDAKLRQAISNSNRVRSLFKEISLMRKADRPPISSRDFVKLHHASFYADRDVMLDVLESLVAELKDRKAPASSGPRLLLTGSTLAMGDYKVLDLLEEDLGGRIVIEHFDEGLIDYWSNVEADGDLMKALAERYFMKQTVAAWFRPSRARLDFIVKLAQDFRASGVIWYQMAFRDCIEIQSFRLPPILDKELGIPMLKLQSDYDREEKNYFKTRAETFLQMVSR
jgi:benzoyl-CoA reductase/2-hydroxyglutaryl-CoA dehydratase subunit BcrC/BadD/HgdB